MGCEFVSFFIDIPLMTLKVSLEKKGFSFHIQRIHFHVYMIHMFGNLMMI
jgi:hypothetical protein